MGFLDAIASYAPDVRLADQSDTRNGIRTRELKLREEFHCRWARSAGNLLLLRHSCYRSCECIPERAAEWQN